MNTSIDAPPPSTQPTARQLRRLTAGAIASAGALFVLVVLPAEFGIDPTGFGRLAGLGLLHAAPSAAPKVSGGATSIAHDDPLPYRCNAIDIPLAAGGDPARRDELEYKVRMAAGESFVYAWHVADIAKPEEFYADFHGEAPASAPGGRATVVEYRQATGTRANGALTAPIDGVHGWYLQNQSAQSVVVRLKLCGFYKLIEPGSYGNQAGIRPKAFAAP